MSKVPTLFDFEEEDYIVPTNQPEHQTMPEDDVIESSPVELEVQLQEAAILYPSPNRSLLSSSIMFEAQEPTKQTITPLQEEPVESIDALLYTELVRTDYLSFAGLDADVPTPKDAIIASNEEVSFIENIEEDKPTEPLPAFDLEDKYYTIGEVANLFQVNVSHIRFWTTEFKLKVRTTRKGDRLYNPENIAKLRLIHHLVKENKHTIKGAKEKLKVNKEAVNAQVDLKDKLSGLKAQLERIKRNL